MPDLEDRLRRLGDAVVVTDDSPRPSARALRAQAEGIRDRRKQSIAFGAVSLLAVISAVLIVGPSDGPRQHIGLLTGASEPTVPTSAPAPRSSAPVRPTPTTRATVQPVAPAPTAPTTTASPTTTTVPSTTTTRPPQCDPATFMYHPPLHFASAGGRVLAAFGNEVLATSADGGRTWSQSCFSAEHLQFSRLAALSSSRVVAIAGADRPGTNAPSVVVQSDDGGRTWSTVQGVTLGTGDYLAGVTFAGATGWLHGGTRATSNDGFEPALWRTRDAGRHWQRIALPVHGTYIPSVSFVDDSTGWLVTNGSQLFRTVDAGDTWTEVALPQPTGWVRSVAATDGHVHVAVSSRTSPSLDGSQGLLSSSDDGSTWSRAPANVLQVLAVDDLVAVAVGDEILRTTDGGATWTAPKRPAPGNPSWFETITRDGRALWATSPGGALTSPDGGVTWVAADVPLR